MTVKEFLKDKKCEFCGEPAASVWFGRIVCGSTDCINRAQDSFVCGGQAVREKHEKGEADKER